MNSTPYPSYSAMSLEEADQSVVNGGTEPETMVERHYAGDFSASSRENLKVVSDTLQLLEVTEGQTKITDEDNLLMNIADYEDEEETRQASFQGNGFEIVTVKSEDTCIKAENNKIPSVSGEKAVIILKSEVSDVSSSLSGEDSCSQSLANTTNNLKDIEETNIQDCSPPQFVKEEDLSIEYGDLHEKVLTKHETFEETMPLAGAIDLDSVCDCPIESLLTLPFCKRPFAEKQIIISNGRPTPDFSASMSKIVKDGKKNYIRKFHFEWYTSVTWLCGCKKTNKLYCWPCILFNTEFGTWNKCGLMDMNSFRTTKKRHEVSSAHVAAAYTLFKFDKTKLELSLNVALKENVTEYNQNVKTNRHILSLLIDAVCYLGSQEIAFREPDDQYTTNNGENCIELLHLLARQDEKLSHHLETSTVFSITSTEIKKNIISAVNDVLIDEIRSEMVRSSFVAIIIDESEDIYNRLVLSTVVRYVLPENGDVQERFLRFHDSNNQSAAKLANYVFELIKEFNIEKKIVALAYNGALVTAGECGGLPSTIKEKYERALFVHCNAHKLNTVLQKSVDHIRECKIFFQTLSGIASFFSKSPKRSDVFNKLIHRRLPQVEPISWKNTDRLVEIVSSIKNELEEMFITMMDDPEEWDGQTRACARGFHQSLKDFDFNFFLNIFSVIFPQADILFRILHTRILDISYCSKQTKQFLDFLIDSKPKFNDIWNKTICGECKSKADLESASTNNRICIDTGRCTKRPRTSDVSDDKETSYQRLFYEVINTFKQHTETRLSDLKRLNFLLLLNCEQYKDYTNKFPESGIKSLVNICSNNFDTLKLRAELSVVYSSDEFLELPISQLTKYLYTNGINSVMPEVTQLARLMLTFPVTNASAEAIFSAVNRIESYLKNTPGEERLSALAMLSIEKKLLKNLKLDQNFYSRVIDKFSQKYRLVELQFK